MKISRKDIGFGKFAWYIDNEITELSESEIVDLVGKDKERKLFSLMNYYNSFDMVI